MNKQKLTAPQEFAKKEIIKQLNEHLQNELNYCSYLLEKEKLQNSKEVQAFLRLAIQTIDSIGL